MLECISPQVLSTREAVVSEKIIPIDSKKPKGENPPEGVVLIHRTTNAILDAIEKRKPGSKERILAKRALGHKEPL